MITVNNFFAHWVKVISIAKYGSDKELPPTFTPWEIYQYSDSTLKHLPAVGLKTIQKHLLYDESPVYYANTTYDRRSFNGSNVPVTGLSTAGATKKKQAHAIDVSIAKRIELFGNQLKNKFIYRIPFRYFSDIGKINFPTKIDYRIKLQLETSMGKLFEVKKLLSSSTTTAPDTDVAIIFTRVPFIQYE